MPKRTSRRAVATVAYKANNQLAAWGTANLFYDLNGNMTSDGTHSYTWDARNHLKQIDSGATASFVYDAFGRRTSKTFSGTTTSFLYDGANAVKEAIGANTANSLMGGLDEVFQRTDSAGARSFLTDALGSTLALTDSSGTLQTTYSFDAFGNTTTSGSANSNTFAYTGREVDSNSLYFYRARYYNPALGRFISEDPLGFEAGPNSYSYVDNDPLIYTDPLGLSQNDVQTIINQAQQITNDMTLNGDRIDNGYLNNLLSTLQRLNPFRKKSPLKGCGEQADTVTAGLKFPTVPYDDPWIFQVIDVKHGPFFHQIGVAHSSNPYDPDIIYDPWNNQIFTVPQVRLPLGP